MFERAIETEYDLRNIGLMEISNLLENGDHDISEGILFFSSQHGIYNSVFYSMDVSKNKTDVIAIRPDTALSFSIIDAARCAEPKASEQNKLIIVPLDKIALEELKQRFGSTPLKVNGFDVQYRQMPLINYAAPQVDKKMPVFVGRCAFDPLENAKRAKELEEMRQYFIKIFSGPKYS